MFFYDVVWNDSLWFTNESFTNSVNWDYFKDLDNNGLYIPVTYDLIWCIPLTIVLIGLRRFLQGVIFTKVGYYLGVPRRRRINIRKSTALEATYRNNPRPKASTLTALSKQTDLSVKQIEIWFRRRSQRDIPTDIQRFAESSWNLLIRGSAFLIGLISLWNKPWLLDTKYTWIDWPRQNVSTDIYCFYLIEMAKYLQLSIGMLIYQRKNDFWISFTHHLCTLILMYFCWVLNFVRIGALIMFVHDTSDPWLDLTKMMVYCKKKRLSEILFVIFVLLWILSKDIIYPVVLLYSTTIEAPKYLPVTKFVFISFNVFLYILLLVQIVWTFTLLKVIVKKMKGGELKDARSDSENE